MGREKERKVDIFFWCLIETNKNYLNNQKAWKFTEFQKKKKEKGKLKSSTKLRKKIN